MHRMSKQKACFLSDLTENLPKPEDLTQLLETVSNVLKLLFNRYIYECCAYLWIEIKH